MSNLLSIKSLNTTIDHEPRIQDILVAEKLGYERPRAIRQIIERNKTELKTYGEFATRRGEPTERGGAPSTEYYLNEGQALIVCVLSKTKKAAEVRKAIIEVFIAWRNNQSPQTLPATEKYITPHQTETINRTRRLKIQSLPASSRQAGATELDWQLQNFISDTYKTNSVDGLSTFAVNSVLNFIRAYPWPRNLIAPQIKTAPNTKQLLPLLRNVMEALSCLQDATSEATKLGIDWNLIAHD